MLYFVKTTFLEDPTMPDKYRVICSENQNLYPEKIFVDIYLPDLCDRKTA